MRSYLNVNAEIILKKLHSCMINNDYIGVPTGIGIVS